MTIHHPAEHTLHQLVDGDLGGDSAATEAHVSRCPQCAAEVQRIERFRRTVAAASRAMVPPPTVWTAVQSRIAMGAPAPPPSSAKSEGAATTTGARRRRSARQAWWRPLIAASVVVAVGAGVLYVANQDRRSAATNAAGSSAVPNAVVRDAMLPGIALTDADDAIVERLRTAIARERNVMPADVAAEVEAQLGALTTAMVVTQAALAGDPNNVQLEAMVDRTRRQREEYVNSMLALLADY